LSIRFRVGVEGGRHQHGRAVEERPRLPAFVAEAEEGPGGVQGQDVYAKCFDQVRFDLAQHLVWLDHLDRRARRVQAQRLAQPVDRADLHSGRHAAAQIKRHSIRLTVVQRDADALS
jgi:hypothetical protein